MKLRNLFLGSEVIVVNNLRIWFLCHLNYFMNEISKGVEFGLEKNKSCGIFLWDLER